MSPTRLQDVSSITRGLVYQVVKDQYHVRSFFVTHCEKYYLVYEPCSTPPENIEASVAPLVPNLHFQAISAASLFQDLDWSHIYRSQIQASRHFWMVLGGWLFVWAVTASVWLLFR